MTLTNDILTRQAGYRLNPYPLGSRVFESLTRLKSNYFLLAFKPGIALQAAELNEMQEIFNLYNTLNLHFYSQWPIVGDNISTDLQEQLTGISGVNYTNPNIISQNFPLISSQIQMTKENDKIKLTFNTGWFTIANPETSRNYWFYNFETKDLLIDPPSTTIPKQVYLNYESQTITSSFVDGDEGYFFHDRSNRFINDITDGADRLKLVITSFSEINDSDPNTPICKVINTGESFILSAINNYAISKIDI